MKNKIAYIVICSVFVVIFNISFFLLKDSEVHGATWISYGFIHLAYIGLLLTQLLDEKHKEVSLRLSSHLVSIIYFIVELITGVIFIIMNPVGFKATLIIQTVLFGLYLIVLLINVIINSKIIDSLEETKYNKKYVEETTKILDSIKLSTNSEQVLSLINKLYDIVHGSQLKSNSEAITIEVEIEHKIRRLEKNILTISVEEQISEIKVIIDLANKRNIIAKKCS